MSTRKSSSPSQYSTTVRFIVGATRALARVAPDLAGRVAAQLFSWTPSRRIPRSDEVAILESASTFDLDVDGHPVRGWSWGSGPTVLLVHGWGGRAGQLHHFVRPLLARGLRVLAFDAPGHGSSPGRRSTLPLFERAARAVADHAGGELAAVIAHSLGAAATVLALRHGLRAERVVLLAPAAHPRDHFRAFLTLLGVVGAARNRTEARIERQLGVSFAEVDVVASAPLVEAQALIVHDREDREIAHIHGEAVARAWPRARFVATSGLGHHRLLADPVVVDDAVHFVAGAHRPAAADETALLERELFAPALRASATFDLA